MAKCPKLGCESTEFKSVKISVDGYMEGAYVLVCKKCETIIGISPKEIESQLNDLSRKG